MNIKDAGQIVRPAWMPKGKTFLEKLGDAVDTLDRIEKLYRQAYDVGSDDDRCRSRDALDDLFSEADDLVGQAKTIASDAEDLR